MTKPAPVNPLYRDIREVLDAARKGAYRAVNTAMVHSYWHVGRLIVEHEQKGKKRAEYGAEVIADLSKRLTQEFGRGFTVRNVESMRQFYLSFPIPHALRAESTPDSKAKTHEKAAGKDLVPINTLLDSVTAMRSFITATQKNCGKPGSSISTRSSSSLGSYSRRPDRSPQRSAAAGTTSSSTNARISTRRSTRSSPTSRPCTAACFW